MSPSIQLKTSFYTFDQIQSRAKSDCTELQSHFHVVVERHQICEASRLNLVLERSFVIAVDEQRRLIRIESASNIRDDFRCQPADQKTRTFDCSNWDGLMYWLHKWLRCDVGAESKSDDPNGVESLLRSFVLEPTRNEAFGLLQPDQLEDYLPARIWMQLIFNRTPSQEELALKRRST